MTTLEALRKYEEVLEEGRGPKVLNFKSPKVPRSKGPKELKKGPELML